MTEPPFSLIFGYLWKIISNLWWLPAAFLLFKPVRFLYHFYIKDRWDNLPDQKKILLEIKLPREVLKPIKAMDQVMAGIHGFHDIVTWREKWIEGQFQQRISFEIVGNGGEIHFYIRTLERLRNFIESNIYSNYPEAEISAVDDYTKYVPQDIPNPDWDLWGADYINSHEEYFPIKTYPKFEIEREIKEEKRIDPLTNLLEGMATLKPGEQLWVQIIAKPVLGRDKPWVEKGREFADKLAKRPAKKKPKPFWQAALEVLITGKPAEEKPEEKELIPPEFKLTPGEKVKLTAVEEKLAKFGYDSNCRFIYLGHRDAFFRPNSRLAFAFFKTVSTEDLSGLKPWARTMTKVKSVPFWFLDKRRLYLRKRRLFRYYCKRWPPIFPRDGKTYVLNTEELATLFHFPSEIVAPVPAVPRVEAKKKGAPPELPIE